MNLISHGFFFWVRKKVYSEKFQQKKHYGIVAILIFPEHIYTDIREIAKIKHKRQHYGKSLRKIKQYVTLATMGRFLFNSCKIYFLHEKGNFNGKIFLDTHFLASGLEKFQIQNYGLQLSKLSTSLKSQSKLQQQQKSGAQPANCH